MNQDNIELGNIEESLNIFLEKRRPSKEIRNKLDIGYERKDQTIVIFEIRPNWRDPKMKQEISIAETKYIKSRSVWKIQLDKSCFKMVYLRTI